MLLLLFVLAEFVMELLVVMAGSEGSRILAKSSALTPAMLPMTCFGVSIVFDHVRSGDRQTEEESRIKCNGELSSDLFLEATGRGG